MSESLLPAASTQTIFFDGSMEAFFLLIIVSTGMVETRVEGKRRGRGRLHGRCSTATLVLLQPSPQSPVQHGFWSHPWMNSHADLQLIGPGMRDLVAKASHQPPDSGSHPCSLFYLLLGEHDPPITGFHHQDALNPPRAQEQLEQLWAETSGFTDPNQPFSLWVDSLGGFDTVLASWLTHGVLQGDSGLGSRVFHTEVAVQSNSWRR